MSETKELLRRGVGGFEPTPDAFDRVLARRDRKRRNQRAAAGVLGIAVFALAAVGFVRLLASEGTPGSDPRSPFEGTWVSTSDADGGTQTMTVRVSADNAVEIVVRDDVATVCSGTPSTMTGTGRIEAGTQLVIPAPVYTCDDGSVAETLSGPPLEEQLRDWTVFLDRETDTLSDGVGGVWLREGAEVPSPGSSGGMWPQTSLEAVQEAQELADAGDPDYTWQVEWRLNSQEWWGYLRQPGAEIVERFLREELGWEQFLFNPYQGDDGDGAADGILRGVVYLRCAPGETNPLYPIAPVGHQEAPGAERCAPTIDEFRYETVSLDLSQLDRRGPDGIWVVSRWAMTAPFTQADPRVVEAEATARLEDFLRARIEGEGAEGYVEVFPMPREVPLLYATTTGAPYERSEIERVSAPAWPYGWMEFTVRLSAEGGETVVEQRISLMDGLSHDAYETTENGQPVAVPYDFFDGEVTAFPAAPWEVSICCQAALTLGGNLSDERVELVADPLPVATGCERGPAPADAEALAQSIRSDPDLVATAPVDVRVGGVKGLVMDVTVAPGASVCEVFPSPLVLTQGDDARYGGPRPPGVDLDQGNRMRLYLLDHPEGSATRILAIAIVAPEARFDSVIEAATPIMDSFEFHAP
ncbi:MAG: hypothetical protein ACXWW5_04810 [Actinomycetota bacterium]